MTRSQFEVRLEGEGLAPETLDVADLARLLPLLRKAVCSAAGIPTEPGSQAVLSLVGVRPGSAELALGGIPTVIEGVRRIYDALTDRITPMLSPDALPPDAQRALHEICKFVVERDWSFRLKGPFAGRMEAVISRESPVEPYQPRRVHGTTTIYGQVRRAISNDDDRHTVGVGLYSTGKVLTVRVTRDMVLDLGRRFLQPIGIEGEAVWDPASWEILDFTASRIIDYQGGSPAEAFKELAEAAGDRWDGVDAEQYVREVRGEDDRE